jgi:hypothetical protein
MSNSTTTRSAPTLTAYTVREFEKDGQTQSSWTRVGIAFAHRDGNGFDIILEAIPVNGRIALRKSEPKSQRA